MASRSQPGAGPENGLKLPDRYQLRRHLASGGMASVWCAEDSVLGRTVAVKVLAERFRDDEMAMRRFKREARAAARVSTHPHVVTIFDVGDLACDEAGEGPGEAGGVDPMPARPFIVMEYLAGGTVADAVRVGAVRRQEALRWIREAGAALDHAHAAGIVHRDIKPANFLLDRSRVLHVADFGIARLMSEDTISSADELFGTAAYLAPEQALGRPATGASDLYALAVAAFELLTGTRPFAATHFAAQARQHVEDPPPRASERDRTLPPFVDDVLARGMAKQPEDRFASAAEFVDALDTAISGGIPVSSIAAADDLRRSDLRRSDLRGSARRPTGPRPDRLAGDPAASRTRFGRRRAAEGPSEATERHVLAAPLVPPAPVEPFAPPAIAVAASTLAAEPIEVAPSRPPRHSVGRGRRTGGWSPAGLIERGARSRGPGRAVALAALLIAVVAVGAIALGAGGGHARRAARVTAERSTPAATPAPTTSATRPARHRSHRTAPSSAAPVATPVAPAPPPSTAVQLQLTGHSEMLAGNYDQAIATLHRAVAAASRSSLTYAYGLYDLARSLVMAGNPTAAVPLLEARLKIPNQTGVVRQMLNRALRASGQVPAQLIAGTGAPSSSGTTNSSSSSSSSSTSTSGSNTTASGSSTSPAAHQPPATPGNGGAGLTPVAPGPGPDHGHGHHGHHVTGDALRLD